MVCKIIKKAKIKIALVCVGVLILSVFFMYGDELVLKQIAKNRSSEQGEAFENLLFLQADINDQVCGVWNQKGTMWPVVVQEDETESSVRLYPQTFPFYTNIGFWERTDNPENTIPDDMIEALQSALQKDEIVDYAVDISADYTQMSEQEILQYIQADTSGVLESYYYDEMEEGAEWFLFSRDEDIMVREKTDKEGYEYVYYKFSYEGDGVYDMGLDAYGKTADYFFIQWDGEDYLMVTRLDSFGESIEGVGVYYMLGYSLIGIVMCLDKNTDDVRFLSYVSNGNVIYGPPYPDY